MSRIDIFYATCWLLTQNVSPTIPGFQVIKRCVQCLGSHPHKPIFYPSNSYYGSNVIILTWSGNKVEDYTTQNFQNSIKMWIVLELSTEDGHFQVFIIICLVLLSAENYIFNQLYTMTSLMDKLDACTRLSKN